MSTPATPPPRVSAHREQLDELRRRVIAESGLALPVPRVSPEIALLLADLVAELGACVLELELLRAIHEPAPETGA